jgi:carbonic anhydrase
MSEIDQLVDNNRSYAATDATATVVPARRTAVVTCMDARINPFALLGLKPGDAHVIRNAGGLATEDVERSLVISQRLLGTREIIVIHHSECGMLGFDAEAFTAALRADAGRVPDWQPGGFSDLDEGVRESVQALRASPFLLHRDGIRGFVLEVATGRLREV